MIDPVDLSVLRGKVVVVTGGGRGIGKTFAQAIAATGAVVAITGRSRKDLVEAVAQIEAVGGRAMSVVFDVSDPQGVVEGIASVERAYGQIDLLINNAGIWGAVDNLWEVNPQEWWRTLEVNIGGTFYCSRAVLGGMIAKRKGRIINIVSNAGIYRWPSCSAYSVSKAAVIKLTENLSIEVRNHGVAVFAFHPGLVTAGMTEQAIGMRAELGSAADRASAWVRSEIAADRSVTPKRAADFLVALAAGPTDGLSGRYISIFDDLDTLIAESDEIKRGDLLTLRLREIKRSGGACR
jgi:NAD(P)-dependent dehydrogenase (short-subunit alcohol dehydrogenase family)